MKLKKTVGGNYEQLESGTYVARLISAIYLGTQFGEWQGQETKAQKVWLTWEIPAERINDTARQQSAEFTYSFNAKSKFLPVAQTLLGRNINDGEEIDMKDLIGKECLLSIGETKTGKAKVTGVARMMSGVTCPEQEHPSVIFNNKENFSAEVFSKLPNFLRIKIESAKEFSHLVVDINGDL